ncbi:MAG: DNA repair protein RecN [Endozoicomonas sp. (ex Botrylloides leachii)]|nr:DNA repair protein RecN [Endozoicomonas sp. (ex Botrylloides leachii)]
MLNQLSISNYAIVNELDLNISKGMTAITGETGAGKSIMLDALGLAIGGRAGSDCIRPGAKRAEIIACFDLELCPAAKGWLEAHDLDSGNECILRRVITKSGRSSGYINGSPSTLADLKAIGELLIDIHGQHEHQSLLKKNTHRFFLDSFAHTTELANKVANIAIAYDRTQFDLDELLTCKQDQHERVQLLSYQLQELEDLALEENEIEVLEKEHRQLSNVTATLEACHQINTICTESDAGNVLQQVALCINKLTQLSVDHPAISQSIDMLSSAHIQVEEAMGEINHFIDYLHTDPQHLHIIEERLSAIYDLARKHRIQPNQLIEKRHSLADEIERIQCHDEVANTLRNKLSELANAFYEQAELLSQKRQKAALKLQKSITSRMALLGMDKALFSVSLTRKINALPSTTGLEDIEFLVTTNPGQPLRPLVKVASGGELSRISLAIQVATAQTSYTPTLVFDEVDVGIGAGTAEVIGSMLREIGQQSQVLCVTHQPQVASQGHQHLCVNKKTSQSQSNTEVFSLTGDFRIQEVARMLGGVDITSSSLAHAKELLGT